LKAASAGLPWQGACLTTGVFTGTPGHLKSFDYTGLHRVAAIWIRARAAQRRTDSRGGAVHPREPTSEGDGRSSRGLSFVGSTLYTVSEILEAIQLSWAFAHQVRL